MTRSEKPQRRLGGVRTFAALCFALFAVATLMLVSSSSEPAGGSGASVIGIIALLVFAVLVFVLFRRFSGPVGPDTPASGRWVAWLRMTVDIALGIVAVTAVALCIGFAAGVEGLWADAGALQVGDDGVELVVDAPNLEVSQNSVSLVELRARVAEGGELSDDVRDYQRTIEKYGTYATLGRADRVNLFDRDPSLGLLVTAVLTAAVGWGAVLTFLFALRALLAQAGRGTPFDPKAVFWLRLMAGAIGVGAIGTAVGRNQVGSQLISGGGADGSFAGGGLGFGWLFGALVLLALAEVWRYGVTLQREAEATV